MKQKARRCETADIQENGKHDKQIGTSNVGLFLKKCNRLQYLLHFSFSIPDFYIIIPRYSRNKNLNIVIFLAIFMQAIALPSLCSIKKSRYTILPKD